MPKGRRVGKTWIARTDLNPHPPPGLIDGRLCIPHPVPCLPAKSKATPPPPLGAVPAMQQSPPQRKSHNLTHACLVSAGYEPQLVRALRHGRAGRFGYFGVLPAVKFPAHTLDVIAQARVIDHTVE